mgnify:CR=1 FL=1
MPKAEILKTYDEDYVDTVIEIAAQEFESCLLYTSTLPTMFEV